MNWFCERLETRLRQRPDMAFLFDETTPKGLSASQLNELSGRVYAYLKSKGVGREAFVLINLPRGVKPLIAQTGVWRAGAAFALVEDTYAPDRIDFIRKDCGAVLELNASAWEEAMKMSPLAGHEQVDPHDAAYAIYTSGTTGTPKGVLHEYGNLKEIADSLTVGGKSLAAQNERFALAAPLNFVASVMAFVMVIALDETRFFILSYATVKNPMKLGLFMLEKRISCTFLTPSYVRALGSRTGPFLKRLFVGSEPANGISPGKLEVINTYAMSESGFAVCVFKIDRAYDTCPIGSPQLPNKVMLLGEDGHEVPNGEIGELCFENPYTRGYLNLPEETARAFRDGIYHSGDLAKRLPSGEYVLLGRNTDMVKINGNRVEPAEVEAAVKQVLGVDWCAVRGFEDDAQAFLAAYYTAAIPKPDTVATREALARRLPYYMLPQYFVQIDKAPLKANGKLDRKALPKPDTSDYVSDYVAPSNETEEALCTAMAAALKVRRIGVNDDFYELGGDSLGSMQVITSCGLRGLSASDIFRGRTPAKIAKLYLARHAQCNGQSAVEKDAKARAVAHPLTAEQAYMVDYQFYTPLSTMYNLFATIRVEKGVFEPKRLAEAVTRVLRHHPAFATTFALTAEAEIVQSYQPDIVEEVHVERMTEFDFQQTKDDLVKPYKIIGTRLYRCRLIETECATYLFFDVHHTIFDGASFKVLMGDIAKAYLGEELEPDFYYLMLQQREESENSPFYLESKAYFEQTYGGDDWVSQPRVDHETRSNASGDLTREIALEQATMKLVEQTFKISRNEFFITAFGLAFALHERARNVKFSWIYNGREDIEAMSTCGLLFRDLPIGLRLADDSDIRDIYAATAQQVAKAIEHSCYPYNDKTLNVVSGDVPYILYQSDIHDAGQDGLSFEQVDVRQNNAASQTVLDAEILDGRDGLRLALHYAASRFERTTMESFADILVKVCAVLAAHTEQAPLTFADIRTRVLGRPSLLARLFGKKA